MKINYVLSKKSSQLFLNLAFICISFFGVSQKSSAQTNIALSATATHSGGGSGAYGPALYNDGVDNGYGSGIWGWVSTNGYIDFTWTSAKSVSKLVFLKDDRPMITCDVQYWNGSSFVTITSYNSSKLSDSITFSPISTTILRLNNVAGSSNPNHREIKIFGPSAAKDAGISAFYNPNSNSNPCGNTSEPLIVTITNYGTTDIAASSNISVKATLTGSGSGTYTKVFNRALKSGVSDTVVMGNLNTTTMSGTLYLKSWARWSADTVYKNDTAKMNMSISGSPAAPKPKDVIKCGQGSVRLNAGVPSNTSAMWYNSNTSTNVLAIDSIYNTPFLYVGSTTYYVESARLGSTKMLTTGIPASAYWFGNIQSGNMFDLKNNKTLVIDSLSVNVNHVNVLSTINVYAKTGTYSGYETNSAAWTLIRTVSSIQAKGIGKPTTFSMGGYTMPAGSYGVYVQISDGIVFNAGALSFSNGDMSLVGGCGITNSFGGIASPYTWCGNIYYRTLCSGPRVAVTATVKPSPYGGAFIKGTPFNSPQATTSGTSASPDIVAAKDVLTYEIAPPKGYTNSGYGSKWITSGLTLRTKSGRVLNPTPYYSYSAPSSTNGKITFNADSLLTDSTIIMTISLRDLGPWYCDSTLTRYIFVAPRPVTDFKFNQPVCDGDAVLFNNLSKISSGYSMFKWDFNTGNPADTAVTSDVVFTFPTYGSYDVSLKSTSIPYGYVTTKTIQVIVTEIPKISFKVINACMGDSLSFVNSTSISAGTIAYKWEFGDGKTSIKKSPKYKYAAAGGYIVTLSANSNGCRSTLSKKANQFIRPVANFTMSGSCSNSDITFNNLTTIGLQDNFGNHWIFGDGGVNNEVHPTHVYTSSGAKTIKYIATSQFGCTDSMIKTINIVPSPEASFTNGPVCNIKPVVFNNSSYEPAGVLTSYSWDFGDGSNISNNKNPQHNYPNLGTHSVKLIAAGNNGCSTTFEKTITVLPQPISAFEALDACAGNDVIFTNKTKGSGLINYKWKFGDGDSSLIFSPIKKYKGTITQTYNVTLTAINVGGCEDVTTLPVNVKEAPICGFTAKSSGTGGFEYTFTPANTSYPFYQWSFEGGGSSNLPSPKFIFQTDGKYRVRVFMKTVDGCDCVDSSQFVTVYHLGVKSADAATGISFFPNPNNGIFNIQVSTVSPSETFTLNILDIIGRAVATSNLVGNKNHPLSYSELSNGLYTIEIVKQSGERITAKMNIIK